MGISLKNLARHLALALLLAFPIAVGGGAGCGTAYQVCDVVCDCTKCNDRTWDECELEINRMLDTAEAYDCVDEMDTFVDCVQNDSECDDTAFSIEDCLEDYADLAECIDDNSDLINFGAGTGTGQDDGDPPAG